MPPSAPTDAGSLSGGPHRPRQHREAHSSRRRDPSRDWLSEGEMLYPYYFFSSTTSSTSTSASNRRRRGQHRSFMNDPTRGGHALSATAFPPTDFLHPDSYAERVSSQCELFACRPRAAQTEKRRRGAKNTAGVSYTVPCCDASYAGAAAQTVDRARVMASRALQLRAPPPPPRAASKTYEEILAENERYRDRAEALRGAPPKTPIEAWLVARNLEKYAPRLERMGIRKVSDLVFLTEDDLNSLEIDPHSRMHFIVRVVA